jgi:hypothetical protein
VNWNPIAIRYISDYTNNPASKPLEQQHHHLRFIWISLGFLYSRLAYIAISFPHEQVCVYYSRCWPDMRVGGGGGSRIRPPFFPGSTGWATAERRRRRRSNIYIALYNLSSPRQHGSLCRRPLWRGNRADQQRISSPGKYWIESLVSRPSSHRAVSCCLDSFYFAFAQLMGLVLHVRRKSQQEKRLGRRHHYIVHGGGSERLLTVAVRSTQVGSSHFCITSIWQRNL